ncbi:unnamed protein product [Peniophora sp. CBMAI 1063]|nr:unnamed protein product [Peniophora sp. CBMAI 1063]
MSETIGDWTPDRLLHDILDNSGENTVPVKLWLGVVRFMTYAWGLALHDEQRRELRNMAASLREDFAALSIVSKDVILENVVAAYLFACRLERNPFDDDTGFDEDEGPEGIPVAELLKGNHEWRSYSYIMVLLVHHDLEVASCNLFKSTPITAAQPRIYIPQHSSHRIADYGTLFVDGLTGFWRSMDCVVEIKPPTENAEESKRENITPAGLQTYRLQSINQHSQQLTAYADYAFQLQPHRSAVCVLLVMGRIFSLLVYPNPERSSVDVLDDLWPWRASLQVAAKESRSYLILQAISAVEKGSKWKGLEEEERQRRRDSFAERMKELHSRHPGIVYHAEEMFTLDDNKKASLTARFRHALQIIRRVSGLSRDDTSYKLPVWALFGISDEAIEGIVMDDDEQVCLATMTTMRDVLTAMYRQWLLQGEMDDFTSRDIDIAKQILVTTSGSKSGSRASRGLEDRKGSSSDGYNLRSASSPLHQSTHASDYQPEPTSASASQDD